MRRRFSPRPTRGDLLAAPLHVIARDFPETLEEFRAHGVSLEVAGGDTLAGLNDAALRLHAAPLLDAESLLEDLETATAWRPSSSST